MTSSLLQNPKTKLIFIIVLALGIRLAGIASRPIWYDEAFSALLAEQGPAAILSGTLANDVDSSAAEEHPPAYYFILWGWAQAFGNSLVAVRMLSIITSLGIILCVYLIASHLFNQQTALTAAFLAAILPFQIHYGQEIRMYVLLTFWLCLATYALLKRQWILFSIAAALAQYTHNLAAFYLIPLAFTPIFQKDWKTLRSLTLAGFAAIIMYSPWLIQLPAQISKVTSSFWIEKPGVEKLFTLFLIYLPNLPLPNNLLLPGLLLATLTIVLAAFQTYRAQKEDPQKTGSGLWLAYLSFTPPLLLWLASQISPMYVERALLPSHAIFCIWLAWAFTQTKLPRPIQLFAFVLILSSAGMGFYQHFTYKRFPYGPYAALDQSIQNRLNQGDVVIHSNKLTYLPSFYFDRELPQSYLIDPLGSSTDTLSPATREILQLVDQENMETASTDATRVWFIIFQQSMDEFTALGYKTHPQLEYLDQHFKLESIETWDDVKIYLYRRSGL
jgi:4-amino-4-deoxy-L-arabinose transferase-like glycosyltransferase